MENLQILTILLSDYIGVVRKIAGFYKKKDSSMGFSMRTLPKREMVCVLKRKPEFEFLKEFLKTSTANR
jgi:hypothetical protein